MNGINIILKFCGLVVVGKVEEQIIVFWFGSILTTCFPLLLQFVYCADKTTGLLLNNLY